VSRRLVGCELTRVGLSGGAGKRSAGSSDAGGGDREESRAVGYGSSRAGGMGTVASRPVGQRRHGKDSRRREDGNRDGPSEVPGPGTQGPVGTGSAGIEMACQTRAGDGVTGHVGIGSNRDGWVRRTRDE
jgi:hypothetical protein